MRVLTFTSLFPNAVYPAHGIFIFQRMHHFARRPGNEVVAVAPVPYFPGFLKWSKWAGHARVPGEEVLGNMSVYHPRYPLAPNISMPFHGWLMFLGARHLVCRLHRQAPFDFIDAHYVFPDGFAAVLLGKALGVPVIVSARGTDMNLFPSFRTIRPMIAWTLQRVAGAIAVCTPLRDAMVAAGLPQEKVRVIGNGVEPQRFCPVNQLEARRHLGLPLDARILVAVGGLIQRKGYHYLIPAVAQMAPHHPHLKLYILGEGPWQGKLQAMIENLGVRRQVSLVGPRPNDELKYWYSAADISCLASSREGWPNVILESMACGTPVVATRVWGTPEVIVSPQLGEMVDQTADSIAAGLQAALLRNWNRDLVANYARQRTWDQVAAEVEQFFCERLAAAPSMETLRPANAHR
jgi:teichuronic acid biosynthesis glycosyltransferase TuaC